MDKREDSNSDAKVVCQVCQKEVPRSAARTAEGRDYSYFFCGAGCYQRWSADRGVDRDAEKRR